MMKILRYKFPTEIEFEPLQVCNASCFSCPYDWLKEEPGYTKKRMSEEEIAILLNKFGENLRVRYKYSGSGLITPFRYSDPLITPNIELILSIAKKYNLKVQITTNARSFNKKKTMIFDKYLEQLSEYIAISIIGSNKEEVKNFMKLDLDETIEKLKEIGDASKKVKNKIKISLRELRGTSEELDNLNQLHKKLIDIGINTSIVKSDWMHNRLSNYEHDLINKENYVVGCNMFNHKILRRINIMVDGNVVLCDDDATGKRIFGNIFHNEIDEIWNKNLFFEHKLIYEKLYNDEKNNLICNGCSRAIHINNQADIKKHNLSLSNKFFNINREISSFLNKNVDRL